VQIGVVESVQGISWTEYTVTGVSNHAGTTPMRCGATRAISPPRSMSSCAGLAREMGGDQVGTVGALSLRPNLINVVPNRAVFTVDLRNTDEEKLKQAEARVAGPHRRGRRGRARRGRGQGAGALRAGDLRRALVDRVERHAERLKLTTRRMPSGAGHDAQMMQRSARRR
jgi:N-carbamoyl-L-amino-acid hydrolase